MVTATPPIVLRTSGGSLTITPDKRIWSQVHLTTPGASRPLGAESLEYIAGHLVSFLADTTPSLRWVFSLSELHCSAYGEHLAGEAILHFQDADAKMLAKLVLTPAERSQWMLELSKHTRP